MCPTGRPARCLRNQPSADAAGLSRIPMACRVTFGRTLLSALVGLFLFHGAVPSAGARNGADSSASPFGKVVKLPILDKHDIHFERVSADEESLQSRIYSIAQDNYGFMWFAGYGLYRYDGYSLKLYSHEAEDPNSLTEGRVKVVFKDRAGNLWFGSDSGGLDRLDPAQNTVTHYRHDLGREGSLSANEVDCLLQDRSGVLWVGTRGGLDRLDPATGTFTHYRHNPQDAGSLSSNEISALFEDRNGNLWVGARTSGLNRLDRATGRFTRFQPDPNPENVGHNGVFCILEDHSGVLWVGIGSWLSSLDVKTGVFTHYAIHTDEPGSQDFAGVNSIHEDRDGVLWLATADNGLLKLDRDRRKFIRYLREPDNPKSLLNKAVMALFEDAEGVLWVGTATGLCRFLRTPPAFVNYQHEAGNPRSLPDNQVKSVLADSKGFLWISGPGRLSRVDRGTGEMKVYQRDPKDPHSLPRSSIFAIHEDRSGTLWFGSFGGGLYRFDRATGRFFAYRHDQKRPDSLGSDLIYCLLEDSRGTLWIGTEIGGLNRYNPATGGFTSWRNHPNDPNSLSQDVVLTIFEDHAGFLWLGTQDGLNRFDPKTQQFLVYRHNSQDPHSLSHNKVNALAEDRQGRLWIGTDSGLERLDRNRREFTSFTKKNGLADNSVEAILEDGQGYLWLATHNGLSKFDPSGETFRNYSELDGLPGNSLGPASCRTPSGELIIGSNNGLTTFYPDRISPNPYVPPVVLTGLNLFNKPVPVGAHSLLHKPIWATDSLTLTHDQSIFTLEFAALSYAIPQKNRYRYRLADLETQWNEVDSRRRLATYTSLPAGKYVFQLQGSNNDGIWNPNVTILPITILPPWWATWWFRSMAGVSLAGAIFAVHHYRLRSLHLAAARLEAQVSERTGELRIAKEAAEAANRAKTMFLANMSHELRTPLNAILGFCNLLQQGDVSAGQRNDLAIINRSGEHLLHMINEVLEVAKIETGRGLLEIAPCDLTAMVRDVVQLMRLRAEAKNLTLLLVQSPEFPRYVRVDAPKFRQVLINLLGNAIQYTERGSVTLRLNVVRADSTEQFLVRCCIEDTGIGIAKDDQARIFQPFVQAGQPAAQKGTGLGLTITRQFVELMGGTIHLESMPGEGSRFCVELPLQAAQEPEVMVPRTNTGKIIGLEPGEPEYRILIVEDSRENSMVLERLLQTVGFQVRTAENGALGVELFQSWRPHFIWMDMRMPVMNGVDAARHIRALDGGQEVRIVAVSASAFANERSEVLAAGLDDFVLKPYLPDEVFECLARHLRIRYRRAEAPLALPSEPAAALRPEDLEALPEQLRKELANVTLTLEPGRIAEVIEHIAEQNGPLGIVLAGLARRFAYTAIRNAAEGRPAAGRSSSASGSEKG